MSTDVYGTTHGPFWNPRKKSHKFPPFSATKQNASILTTCHAAVSARIEGEGQQARKKIDRLRHLPDKRAAFPLWGFTHLASRASSEEVADRPRLERMGWSFQDPDNLGAIQRATLDRIKREKKLQ